MFGDELDPFRRSSPQLLLPELKSPNTGIIYALRPIMRSDLS